MELDLLGLGLPPAAASGGSEGSPARRPHENTAFDEPLRPGTAETPSLPARARVRPRPADMDDDVLAPPASMLKPTPMAAAPWPARPSSSAKVALSPTGSDLAAGQGQAGAVAMLSAPVQTAGCPAPAAAAARGIPDDSTAPMTIIYDGSVRVFYKVSMGQAEKILSMVAKLAQAVRTPSAQQPDQPRPQPAAAAPSSASATQMMIMLWRLANLEDNLVPKRTASLARFLDKRKQRVEGAAAATPCYPRGDEFPAQMDAFSARNEASFGGMERPWASEEDRLKSMKENHGEDAVNTELRI